MSGTRGKSGRRPKYQNKTAFKHNRNSRKTKKILASPNEGLCARCHEKIEWRKKYRKYKPLTQPRKCDACSQRTVTHAYHELCTDCAKEKGVCPKCRQPEEIVREIVTKEEQLRLESEERERLLYMSERERRAYDRQRGKNNRDDDDDDDDANQDDGDSDMPKRPPAGPIQMPGGPIDTLATPSASWSEGDCLDDAENGMMLVQFPCPPESRWLQSLLATGVRNVQFNNKFSYSVFGDAESLARAETHAASSSHVAWYGPMMIDYKISPDCAAHLPGTFTVQVFATPLSNSHTEALLRSNGCLMLSRSVGNMLNGTVEVHSMNALRSIAQRPDVVVLMPRHTPTLFGGGGGARSGGVTTQPLMRG